MALHVELDLGAKKPLRLRYNINAFSDIERAMGVGLSGLISGDRVGLDTIRMLIWGGAKWADPRMTPERAGMLLQRFIDNGGDLDVVGTTITEAMFASGLVDKEDPDDNEDPDLDTLTHPEDDFNPDDEDADPNDAEAEENENE